MFFVFPNELDENQSISLICSADVGSPRGYTQIWKISRNSIVPILIHTSNSKNNKTENCTEYINITTTYTVTRKDNGAIFICSSQNNFTRGPGPRKESQTISVLCRYTNYETYIQCSIMSYHVSNLSLLFKSNY